MRRIVLELAEDTSETHCGHCRALSAFRGNVILARSCSAFRVTMDTKGPAMRVPDCLAAERTASRLLDVSPEVASEYCRVFRVGGPDDVKSIVRTLYEKFRNHAKKAEVKL